MTTYTVWATTIGDAPAIDVLTDDNELVESHPWDDPDELPIPLELERLGWAFVEGSVWQSTQDGDSYIRPVRPIED